MCNIKNKVIIAINGAGTSFIEWLSKNEKEESVIVINRHKNVLDKITADYKIFADKKFNIEPYLLEAKDKLVDKKIFIVLALADDYSDVLLKKILDVFQDILRQVCIIAVTPFDFEGKIRLKQSEELKQYIKALKLKTIDISYQAMSDNANKGILMYSFLNQVNEKVYYEIQNNND